MRKKQHRIRSSRELGQVIAAARRQRGMTQRQIADAMGVTQAWVSNVEQGKQRAWVGQVLRLMAHLGITLDCTIQDDDSMPAIPASAGSKYPNINDLVD